MTTPLRRRGRIGPTLALALCFASAPAARARETVVDFRDAAAASPFRENAAGAALSQVDGKRIYRPDPAVDAYRWLNLRADAALAGNVEVEFSFALRRLDHFNGLRLTLSAEDKSWEASLHRRQHKAGEQQVMLDVTVKGARSTQTLAAGFREGALRLARQGGRLSAFFREKDGPWQPAFESVDVADGSCLAAVQFYSPAKTLAEIELVGYRQRDDAPAAALRPGYPSPRAVATLENGGVRLLAPAGGKPALADGGVRIAPGGRAVFFVQGPLTLGRPSLSWRSEGALKLSGVQLGTAETLQLGETLLWDETAPADPGNPPGRRSLPLTDFVVRHARQRQWNHPDFSHDNLYVFTFEPAADAPATVADVVLSGAPLSASAPSSDLPSVTPDGEIRDRRLVLSWKPPESGRAGWNRLPEASDAVVEWAGIPFRPSTTVLGPDFPGFSIPLGRTAGRFHIAHAAGPQRDDSSWTAARYAIVYEDGTVESVAAGLRWNCGVFESGFYPVRRPADHTWWGPASVGRAAIHYLPLPVGAGVMWNALYVASFINPHPEKKSPRPGARTRTRRRPAFRRAGGYRRSRGNDPLRPGGTRPRRLPAWGNRRRVGDGL